MFLTRTAIPDARSYRIYFFICAPHSRSGVGNRFRAMPRISTVPSRFRSFQLEQPAHEIGWLRETIISGRWAPLSTATNVGAEDVGPIVISTTTRSRCGMMASKVPKIKNDVELIRNAAPVPLTILAPRVLELL